VIHAKVTGQVFGVTPVAIMTEVGDDPTVVVAVQLVTCQVMECKLDGTLVEYPQYYFSEGPDMALFLIFSSSTNMAWYRPSWSITALTRASNDS
jgi:hypothetical protein